MHSYGRTVTFNTLGRWGGTSSQGVAVNKQGEVVGSAQNAQQTWVGMVYSGGQSETLPIEIAYGLNNRGQIVGSSNVPPPAPHVMESIAAQLYQNGTVTNLGSLGGHISAAFGINDRGEIVGYSDTGPDTTSPLHAFFYRDGKLTDLGTLGGQNSDATAINSHGVITGAADLPPTSTTTPEHAFIYRSGRMIDLGVVGSDVSSSGSALNDYDEVVGFTSTGTNTTSGTMFAMVYTHGKMYHLQDVIDPSSRALASHVNLYEATGINDDGWIAVNGYDTNDMTPPNQFFGLPRSYLMRPVRQSRVAAIDPNGSCDWRPRIVTTALDEELRRGLSHRICGNFVATSRCRYSIPHSRHNFPDAAGWHDPRGVFAWIELDDARTLRTFKAGACRNLVVFNKGRVIDAARADAGHG